MTTNSGHPNPINPFFEEEIDSYHSPEPWTQDGRYIRDASGAIVVRGRTMADARRIVAAINATRDMPTEALESWLIQDVSDPNTRPDLEVALGEDPLRSPYAVRPPPPVFTPAGAPLAPATPPVARPVAPPVARPTFAARGYYGAAVGSERRAIDRRAVERRVRSVVLDPASLVFDRRVMDRRFSERRGP
jgi:hypothetical protein